MVQLLRSVALRTCARPPSACRGPPLPRANSPPVCASPPSARGGPPLPRANSPPVRASPSPACVKWPLVRTDRSPVCVAWTLGCAGASSGRVGLLSVCLRQAEFSACTLGGRRSCCVGNRATRARRAATASLNPKARRTRWTAGLMGATASRFYICMLARVQPLSTRM
jgi:hypothetical protein